ncbi:unnamed protein product [Agarophyton chilense]
MSLICYAPHAAININYERAASLAATVASKPLAARQLVTNEVDAGGLLLLNRILVEAGRAHTGRALRAVTSAITSADTLAVAHTPISPVYIFCSAGKDRTGLLVALLLSVLGVDEHRIVLDYTASEAMWRDDAAERLRVDYVARLHRAGLQPAQWLAAPPHVMADTLAYIRLRFGSVSDYLIACGFGEREWTVLRRALSTVY